MTKRQLLMMLIIVVFGLLTEIPVGPASATCYGSGCNGLAGGSNGCSTGSYVVSETPIYDAFSNEYIGEVLLTWSPTCQTAWAGTYVGGDLVRPFFVQATVTSTSPSNSYTRTNNYVYVAVSPMVYATDVSYVTVCGRIEDPGVSGSACSP